MENKLSFLYAAINDCQSTIRAIDTKLGALLAAMLVPIGSIDKIWTVISTFMTAKTHIWATCVGYLFFIIWGLIVFVLVRTLSAIDNPKKHIQSSDRYSGIFYCGDQYEFNIIDVLKNRSGVESKNQMSVIASRYPTTKEDIQGELSFEHVKLVYIRDIKLYRLKWGVTMACAWGVYGVVIYFLSK